MKTTTKSIRTPSSVLEEQWYGFVHELIENMQTAYRNAQKEDPPVNQKVIAERLGRKPSFISRCLSGQTNMTIRAIHDLARAMDCRLEVSFRPLKTLRRPRSPILRHANDRPLAKGADHELQSRRLRPR
jgi:hypothetical protein